MSTFDHKKLIAYESSMSLGQWAPTITRAQSIATSITILSHLTTNANKVLGVAAQRDNNNKKPNVDAKIIAEAEGKADPANASLTLINSADGRGCMINSFNTVEMKRVEMKFNNAINITRQLLVRKNERANVRLNVSAP